MLFKENNSAKENFVSVIGIFANLADCIETTFIPGVNEIQNTQEWKIIETDDAEKETIKNILFRIRTTLSTAVPVWKYNIETKDIYMVVAESESRVYDTRWNWLSYNEDLQNFLNAYQEKITDGTKNSVLDSLSLALTKTQGLIMDKHLREEQNPLFFNLKFTFNRMLNAGNSPKTERRKL
jgi:hypothetical protein